MPLGSSGTRGRRAVRDLGGVTGGGLWRLLHFLITPLQRLSGGCLPLGALVGFEGRCVGQVLSAFEPGQGFVRIVKCLKVHETEVVDSFELVRCAGECRGGFPALLQGFVELAGVLIGTGQARVTIEHDFGDVRRGDRAIDGFFVGGHNGIERFPRIVRHAPGFVGRIVSGAQAIGVIARLGGFAIEPLQIILGVGGRRAGARGGVDSARRAGIGLWLVLGLGSRGEAGDQADDGESEPQEVD